MNKSSPTGRFPSKPPKPQHLPIKATSLTRVGGATVRGVRYDGFTRVMCDDGTGKFFGQTDSLDEIFAKLAEFGIDFEELELRVLQAMKPQLPPKPVNATEFFTGYGYKPVQEVVAWEWSTTFGRWGAVVIFPDGLRCYTYPRPELFVGPVRPEKESK